MAHFTRELSDEAWFRGLSVPHTAIRNIDEKTKKAISGSGGTYDPTDPIVIAGAGLELQCGLDLGSLGTKAQPAEGKAFIFGDDDFFKFSSPVTRDIQQSVLESGGANLYYAGHAQPWMDDNLVQPPQLRTVRTGAFLRIPMRIPDGSNLQLVLLGFRVNSVHADIPENLPRARVVRIAKDGVITPVPGNTTTTSDPDGWVPAETPASGAAWYNAAADKLITLNFDTAAEAIDTTTYGYALEFKDEHGANCFTDEVGTSLTNIRFTVYQTELRPY